MRKSKPKAKENILTPQEREKFLKAIKTDDEELVVKGLLFTGVRISEFIHMRRDWVNFSEGIIHIPHGIPCRCSQECRKPRYKYYKRDYKTKQRVKLDKPEISKPPNTWQGKTKQAERPIPILPEVEQILRNYFADYECIMDLIDNRINAWRMVKDVGERAGVSHKVFPHAVRATFATMLVEKGMEDAVALTQIMGWTDIKMAMIYIKLGGQSLKKKVDRIWSAKLD